MYRRFYSFCLFLVAVWGLSSCSSNSTEDPKKEDLCPIVTRKDTVYYVLASTGAQPITKLHLLKNDDICWKEDSTPKVPLILSLSTAPSYGLTDLDADDMNLDFLYQASTGAADGLTDVFTYKICEPDGTCSEAEVYIIFQTIFPCESVVANDDNLSIDLTAGPSFELDYASNDEICYTGSAGPKPSYSITLAPFSGTAVFDGDLLIYTPAEGTTEPLIDFLTYQICVDGLCDDAVVTINSLGGGSGCTVSAFPDNGVVSGGLPLTIDVLANDTDCPTDGELFDPSSLTITLPATYGTASVIGGAVVYTPSGGTFGTVDNFEYEICTFTGTCVTGAVTIIYGL